MFCNKCGANNFEQTRYCSCCGEELAENGQDEEVDYDSNLSTNNNKVSDSEYYEVPEPEYYKAAIGDNNTDYYLARFKRFDYQSLGISWNCPACFLSFSWYLYRKMWVWAMIYILIFTLCNFFDFYFPTLPISIIQLGSFLLFTIYANTNYHSHVKKKILKAKKLTDDKESRLSIIADEGGTSSVILVVILCVLIMIINIIVSTPILANLTYVKKSEINIEDYELCYSGITDRVENDLMTICLLNKSDAIIHMHYPNKSINAPSTNCNSKARYAYHAKDAFNIISEIGNCRNGMQFTPLDVNCIKANGNSIKCTFANSKIEYKFDEVEHNKKRSADD